MPVTIDESRVPPSWAKPETHPARGAAKNGHSGVVVEPVRIALVNNMPDSALEDTELQFCELLENAAGDIPVHLHLFSLPDLSRGDRGKQHIATCYHPAAELANRRRCGDHHRHRASPARFARRAVLGHARRSPGLGRGEHHVYRSFVSRGARRRPLQRRDRQNPPTR